MMKTLFDHPMTKMVPTSNGHDLLWRDDLGIGFLPSNGMEYSDEYWQKYQGYLNTPTAIKINECRLAFVLNHFSNDVSICDVGIGNGDFLLGLERLYFVEPKGFDVNPLAREWLESRGSFLDPCSADSPPDVLTFWDVLEHIEDPGVALVSPNVFVSIPIHADLKGCLSSKHLRPDEHLWHFTEQGFITFMRFHGYEAVESNRKEQTVGREDIMSFFFHRVDK